jgi:WD40 repeat protein
VNLLEDGRLLTWRGGEDLKVWSRDASSGQVLQTDPEGVLVLGNGRILSWGEDRTVRIWRDAGDSFASLDGDFGRVQFQPESRGDQIFSWSGDGLLRHWSAHGTPPVTMLGHICEPDGAEVLEDGRIVSWSQGKVWLWSEEGAPIGMLEHDCGTIENPRVLKDGRILWFADDKIYVWSPIRGRLAILEGHHGRVTGAAALDDGRILSWSGDNTLRLWSADGRPLSLWVYPHSRIRSVRSHPSDLRRLLVTADDHLFVVENTELAPAGVCRAFREA